MCLSVPRTVLVLTPKVQPPRKPFHPGRTGMAGPPNWLVGQPGANPVLEIFLHYLYVSCPTAAFRVGVITHSPQAGHRGSEGPRLPSWPLLSKWTWQAWNAGRRWMPKAPMFSVASQRQRQRPLVKTNGSDHGCQAPHSLGRLTRKGTKLFAGNSNRTVPRLPRQPFPTHTKAWANTGAAISSRGARARAAPGRPS